MAGHQANWNGWEIKKTLPQVAQVHPYLYVYTSQLLEFHDEYTGSEFFTDVANQKDITGRSMSAADYKVWWTWQAAATAALSDGRPLNPVKLVEKSVAGVSELNRMANEFFTEIASVGGLELYRNASGISYNAYQGQVQGYSTLVIQSEQRFNLFEDIIVMPPEIVTAAIGSFLSEDPYGAGLGPAMFDSGVLLQYALGYDYRDTNISGKQWRQTDSESIIYSLNIRGSYGTAQKAFGGDLIPLVNTPVTVVAVGAANHPDGGIYATCQIVRFKLGLERITPA